MSSFGMDECFPLAFGVPAMLMVVAVGLFVAGTRWYTRRPPQGAFFVLMKRGVWRVARGVWRS